MWPLEEMIVFIWVIFIIFYTEAEGGGAGGCMKTSKCRVSREQEAGWRGGGRGEVVRGEGGGRGVVVREEGGGRGVVVRGEGEV